MSITDEQLDGWAAVARAATNSAPWEYGETAPGVDGEKYIADCYRAGRPGPIGAVHFDAESPGESWIVAITGNGTDSAANAKHIAYASPRNVMALIGEVRALRAELAQAREVPGRAEVLAMHTDAEIDALTSLFYRVREDEFVNADDGTPTTAKTARGAAMRAVLAKARAVEAARQGMRPAVSREEAERLVNTLVGAFVGVVHDEGKTPSITAMAKDARAALLAALTGEVVP